MPSEHGGWGLTLEPAVLGLLVAPSVAGGALGIAALAAFLFRTPFKIAAGDLRRDRRTARTLLAVRAAVGYGIVLAVSITTAVITAGHPFWQPLAFAAPLVVLQAAYDVRSRSRRLVPEIAGPVAIASIAASIALAGGEETATAYGLWLVMALRAAASVILVRAQLRRAKAQPYRKAPAHLAAALGAAIATGVAVAGWVPWLGATAIAALVPFGWWSLARPPVRAVVVGIHQTVVGIVVVALTAAGVAAGL